MMNHTLQSSVAAGASVCLILTLSSGCDAPGDGHRCSASVTGTHEDTEFNELFTRFDGGWTGGGEALSVPLPDGRNAWLFGETVLGVVHPDRSRPPDSPVIRNSLVVQDGADMTTLHGGTPEAPEALFIFIYGTEELHAGTRKFMHVARGEANDVLGPWEFFDGEDWSESEAASARVFEGVASLYSVIELDETYYLVTQETSFHQDIVVYESDTPVGPWRNRTTYYCPPESGGDIFTANAVAHPQFTSHGELLVSYAVNSFEVRDIFENADNFRPRFLRFPLWQ